MPSRSLHRAGAEASMQLVTSCSRCASDLYGMTLPRRLPSGPRKCLMSTLSRAPSLASLVWRASCTGASPVYCTPHGRRWQRALPISSVPRSTDRQHICPKLPRGLHQRFLVAICSGGKTGDATSTLPSWSGPITQYWTISKIKKISPDSLLLKLTACGSSGQV
jgi:hypothetical protein